MSLMTIAPAADGPAEIAQYLEGRADAYGDSRTLTLDALRARAGQYIAHHPSLAAAHGYSDCVLELRLQAEAVTAAETELAHTDHTKAGTR